MLDNIEPLLVGRLGLSIKLYNILATKVKKANMEFIVQMQEEIRRIREGITRIQGERDQFERKLQEERKRMEDDRKELFISNNNITAAEQLTEEHRRVERKIDELRGAITELEGQIHDSITSN
jgi:predicted  nucleic acid-binding Zn-ribbon protein